jgi:hypothetical protein
MKTMRKITMLAVAALVLCGLQACSVDGEPDSIDEINQRVSVSDDASNLIQALVTTKTTADGHFYLQESEKRLLNPVNMPTSPFNGKEVRAIVYYTEVVQTATNQAGMVDVYVKWIDEIHTRSASLLEGAAGTDSDDKDWEETFTKLPIDIVNDWVNSLTDGYLTLHYHALENNLSDVYLLTGRNPHDPYEMILWGVPAVSINNTIMPSDGLIAFKLDNLPPTGGDVKIATLRWFSPTGWKQAQFYYKTKE